SYLDKPVYSTKEIPALMAIAREVRAEKPDLPMAYRLVLDDLERRLQTDHSRNTLNVATSAFLALATPRLSSFLLEFVVIPAYEKDNKPEIVRALNEELQRSER